MSSRVCSSPYPVGSSLCLVKPAWPMSSRFGPSIYQAQSPWAHVEQVGLGACPDELAQTYFQRSRSGPMSSRVCLGPYLAKWFRPISSRVVEAHIESSQPRPIWSWVSLGQYRLKLIWAHTNTIWLSPMSSRFSSGWCRSESAQALIEPGAMLNKVRMGRCWAKSMSTRFGPGPCWAQSTWALIEWSWPGFVSSRVGASPCRAESAQPV